MSQYYFTNQNLIVNSTIVLEDTTAHHCINVLRMQQGYIVNLTNGKGDLAEGQILNAQSKNCSVHIISVEKKTPPYKNSIAISLLKNQDRFEWLLEKATEMGIYEIYPLHCARTEKMGFKLDRANKIILSAMLQSKQCYLPILHPVQTFEESILKTQKYTNKWIAHCDTEILKKRIHSNLFSTTSNIVYIGPEGDFTKSEINFAVQKSYQAIDLGHQRLRTETAALFVVNVMYYQTLTLIK